MARHKGKPSGNNKLDDTTGIPSNLTADNMGNNEKQPGSIQMTMPG
ncbi:MAG TPA: hypothetical protein VJU78_13030 [Chitinophagaceae bacterium]|nr:hypothetical protein [Chitinophagaceae bacterium]